MSPRNVLGRNFAFERCGIVVTILHAAAWISYALDLNIVSCSSFLHLILFYESTVQTVHLDLTSRVANYIEEVFTFHIMA